MDCIFVCDSFDPSIHMVQNDIDMNNNYGLQTFSHLEIPIKDQCLIDITKS